MDRKAGILLHPTALWGTESIGVLDRAAYKWVDTLKKNGVSIWQVLPLGPTGFGNSPYSALSSFAANPLLIPLSGESKPVNSSTNAVDWQRVLQQKPAQLNNLALQTRLSSDMEQYFALNSAWLDDFALFMAIKNHFSGKPWYEWPKEFSQKDPDTLRTFAKENAQPIQAQKILQWHFDQHWSKIKHYANSSGIEIFGDIPFYPALDSADVWADCDHFLLDSSMRPTEVAGVPPDYFSEDGQLWGNPLYDWEYEKNSGYQFWTKRLLRQFKLYDFLRIDHFRAFESYWAVVYGNKTAKKGTWRQGPGLDFFRHISGVIDVEKLIAEDLGLITDKVRKLLRDTELAGMAVAQFAFDGSTDNPHLPQNVVSKSVYYTATHDNNTTAGWFNESDAKTKKRVLNFLGCKPEEVVTELVRVVLQSRAAWALMPLQDLFALDTDSRFNVPGKPEGNWGWRASAEMISDNRQWEELKKQIVRADRQGAGLLR